MFKLIPYQKNRATFGIAPPPFLEFGPGAQLQQIGQTGEHGFAFLLTRGAKHCCGIRPCGLPPSESPPLSPGEVENCLCGATCVEVNGSTLCPICDAGIVVHDDALRNGIREADVGINERHLTKPEEHVNIPSGSAETPGDNRAKAKHSISLPSDGSALKPEPVLTPELVCGLGASPIPNISKSEWEIVDDDAAKVVEAVVAK